MPKPDCTLLPLHRLLYEESVQRALAEDLGRAGDVTTDAIVAAGAVVTKPVPPRTTVVGVPARPIARK